MTSLMRWVRMFRREERGTVAFLAVCALVPLTLMVFYVANTATSINDKTRAQDAADMISLVHAAEAARSLNTISMNQVSQTQVFSAGVTTGSLIPIITAQVGMAAASAGIVSAHYTSMCSKRYKALKAIPIVGGALFAAAFGACMVPLAANLAEYTNNSVKTGKILLDYDVFDAVENANNAIKALNAKNDTIYQRYPEAVSVLADQIAESAKVRNIYFDDHCADGSGSEPPQASSCSNNNKRFGMNLPVVNTQPLSITNSMRLNAHLRFCAAANFGTAVVYNGSYVKRGFNQLEGPLAHGGDDENPHLRDFVNGETGIGAQLEDYYGFSTDKTVFDGLINPPATAARMAVAGVRAADTAIDLADMATGLVDGVDLPEGVTLEDLQEQISDVASAVPALGAKTPQQVGGLNWPYEQTEDKNVYKDLVNLRVANMCAGDAIGAFTSVIPSGLSSVLGFLTGALENIDVYHPAGEGDFGIPVVAPSFDDFSDHFKVVAFAFRAPNSIWSPNVFDKPTEGYFAASQSIVYNMDEIGLFSQNWRARMMPATKLEEKGSDIAQRMKNDAHEEFHPMADRMSPVANQGSWADVVAR